MDRDQIRRRHFIAIATSTFEASGKFQALDVATEVASLRAWLANEALGERRFDDADFQSLAECPTYDDIRYRLISQQQFNEGDAVVLYVTGHGFTDGGRHWVVLRDSDPDRLSSTAIATADLVRWLAEHRDLSQVFIIIDLCQAGAVLDELPATLMRDLPNEWIALLTTPAGVDAKVGAFSGVLASVIAELRAASAPEAGQEYLESHILTARLMRRLLQDHGQRLTVLRDPYKQSVCLPNPGYDESGLDRVKTTAARRDLAILREDMAAHWAQRAPVTPGQGAVFTGRALLMSELIAFADGPPGTLVVAGRAGSGKSAALARLVTCSDPVFRAEHAALLGSAQPVPSENAVDVAVLATGKTSEQIAQQIALALDAEDRSGRDLDGWIDAIVTAIRARSRPPTVVIDALDEASDPAAVALTLLERLNPKSRPRLRLLIGIRSTGAGADTADQTGSRELADVVTQTLEARQIRVDSDALWEPKALADYVKQLLMRGSYPYREVEGVARAVEQKAGRSYLVARLVAQHLIERGEPLEANDPRLAAVLARGVRDLLVQDLESSIEDPDQRTRVLLLLRAAALAFGRGIPWRNVWPLVGTAIAVDGTQVGDSDVEWLLRHRVSGYLVRDLEDGLTVYRPFHDELRTSLAEGIGGPLDVATAHQRISIRLLPLASWGRDPS